MEAKEVKSFSKPTGYCFLSHTPEWIHNLFNNIIFNIVKLNNTEVPDDLWKSIFTVRENMLAILEKHYIKSKHYIFTNELIDGDPYDQRVYNSVVRLSEKMGVTMLSIVLHCDYKKLIKRIQSSKRRKVNKVTDPSYIKKKIAGKKLFVPNGALEIDNSNLSVKEVAKKIIDKVRNKKLVEASISSLERTRG
ncbi:hypothetical protein [Wolbachia endosymbiont of Ctenocephalides felis wCfeT]|uniref:hypothetical protein n=1 Tax=Wolbachia endosymbiont of Ctenocephalides felis wCfeT TaxID=2732593 RepID=UPI001445903E|nr:hypothetical protein [Wolbachia endosymbiont of Ctenocephalides felis wCfeT]